MTFDELKDNALAVDDIRDAYLDEIVIDIENCITNYIEVSLNSGDIQSIYLLVGYLHKETEDIEAMLEEFQDGEVH